MKYTIEQIKDIANASESIEYFANKFAYVTDHNLEKKKVILNDFQLEVLEQHSSNDFFLRDSIARRQGKTLVAAIILLHGALFKERTVHAILGPNFTVTREVMSYIIDIYKNLPECLKVAKLSPRKYDLNFDNGSRIISVIDIDRCRGLRLETIYLDEYKHIQNMNELLEKIGLFFFNLKPVGFGLTTS